MKLSEFAKTAGAAVIGNGDVEISGVCSVENLKPGCVAFLEKKRDAATLIESGEKPAALICADTAGLEGLNLLVCDNPRLVFIEALKIFHPEPEFEPGIHPAASVHPEADIDPSAHIGACAVVERGARIGARSAVMPCAYVGPDASVGADCRLHPQCAVLRGCELGDRVILHSGVVIGGDGFGYMQHEGKHLKIPQIGRVVVEDDVEIGANSAVDRAALEETRICAGAKIDNLVQIGHNCRIGRGVVLCGQAGIAGSCDIGDYVVLAGQAGIGDHIKVGAKAIIGGQAGVIRDVPEGKFYSGMPAQPHRETMRAYSALGRLPQLEEEIAALRAEMESLKNNRG